MMQEAKKRNRKSVANVQQTVEPDGFLSNIVINLMSYIKKTEIPILSEYAAENNLHEEYILACALDSKEIKIAVQILENKKRAALERKIYTSELNATIGAHLLKSWRENVLPEPPPKVRNLSPPELWDAGISDEDAIIYGNVMRQYLFHKNSKEK